jgi:hypothetical protein
MFGHHLENVPWDAVSTTAGKAVTRNTEAAIPETHETTCFLCHVFRHHLENVPGMLSAQLLGKLLPEIEESSNTRHS